MLLGIFGGSFDPVHLGHLRLAECCQQQAGLDQVWFVPTAIQPLKQQGPTASDAQRCEMLRLAIAERKDWHISRLEIDRGGVSYTLDTLRTIQADHPDATLFFLMGADSLQDLPHWHKPEEICRLAIPLVVRRAGAEQPDFEILRPIISDARLEIIRNSQVEMPGVAISSSQIRSRVFEQGDDWQAMVPPAVAQYIKQHGLYGQHHGRY